MNQKIMTFGLYAIMLSSCGGSECETTNPIFNSFPSTSLEYKKELVSQINKKDLTEFSYWFEDYIETDEREFIKVNIRGKGICAEGLLLVEEWDDKIKNIKRVGGESYKVLN